MSFFVFIFCKKRSFWYLIVFSDDFEEVDQVAHITAFKEVNMATCNLLVVDQGVFTLSTI